MEGLTLAVGEQLLAAFLLALGRTAGFVLTCPPFSTRTIPGQVKAGLSIALALPLTTWMRPGAPDLQSGALVLQMALQVFLGVLLGFLVMVAVATVQAVGDLLDLVGGFSLTIAMDPLMLMQSSVLGRLHQLFALTLLFVTDGHLMVLQGLARSVQSAPAPAVDWDGLAQALTRDVAGVLSGALLVAAPVVAALLVADVGLGLLTRAAPMLNAFALASPLKILFTLLLVGLVLVRLPEVLERLVEAAVLTGLGILGVGR